jgi:hypothetical protein
LRERNARYLVGTPKAQLRDFESALLDKEGWQSVQSGLEARLIAHPDGKGEEQYVLCRSTARAEKERAMLARQTEKLCAELQKIDTALRAKPDQKSGAIERRIGRWLGKYPAAAKVIQATVERDPSGAACALTITSHLEKGRWKDQAHGAYLLRTNCTETDPAKLWRWYIQLTQAEAAFRTAKSDLKLRPIYHQKPGGSKRTSSCASSRWRNGGCSNNGCTAKASARARANSSPKSARSKAWTAPSPYAGAKRKPN